MFPAEILSGILAAADPGRVLPAGDPEFRLLLRSVWDFGALSRERLRLSGYLFCPFPSPSPSPSPSGMLPGTLGYTQPRSRILPQRPVERLIRAHPVQVFYQGASSLYAVQAHHHQPMPMQ